MTITMPGRFTLGAAVAVLALTGLFLAVVATSTGSVQGSEQQCEYDVILMEEVCTSSDGETTLSTTSTPTPEPTEETDLARWMPVPDVLHDGSLRPTKEPSVIPPIPPIKNFKYTISTATPKPRVRMLRQIRDVQVQNDQGAQGQGALAQQTTPTITTLVSNIGNQNEDNFTPTNGEHAQAFTTGSNAFGYRLTGVELKMAALGMQTGYSLSIHKSSSGLPGSKLGTLTRTSAIQNSFAATSFPAPGNGIDLAANTTYWVVTSVNGNIRIEDASSDAEDAGGAAGWSIGNDRINNNPSWGAGTTHSDAMKMAVKGYAHTGPRAPIHTTFTNADGEEETVEIKAASAELDTLLEHYREACISQKSVRTVHNYEWFNADGRRMQARNGWRWLERQDSSGKVTHTSPMTIDECVSHSWFQRRAFCEGLDDGRVTVAKGNEGNICPVNRSW